ncbi:MAG: DUF3237 family protein [Ilumatobacteraceae bacterium]
MTASTPPHSAPASLATRYLMTIRVQAPMPRTLGTFPQGERRQVAFTAGTFEGADGTDLRGTLAAGGVDWQTVRSDGAVELRAHYLLLTDRDEAIEVQSDGIRIVPGDVAARLAQGDPVDPTEYYFRTHIRLSTGALRLAHLNDRIAVSTGERRPDAVHVHVHEVL